MSIKAKAYIGTVICIGLLLSLLASAQGGVVEADWIEFTILVVLAIAAHLLKVEGGNNEAWHFNLSFFLAGVLLLPPLLIVLLIIVPHGIEWIKENGTDTPGLRNWYIQPFNISAHIISALTVYWLFITFNPNSADLTTISATSVAIIMAIVYVIINHALIGQALVLARGVSWYESGILRVGHLMADLAVLMQGYMIAIAWHANPLLLIPTLSPLILMYRGLLIPKLQQEARVDEKTGLWNARHFKERFTIEFEKAQQLEKPLAAVMADLDLLRNVNNKHGHLAGDIVLTEVGKLIRGNVAHHHIASRFGGEEFCIIMPETEIGEARAIAETIRTTIEAYAFPLPNSEESLHVTISMGIASFPNDAYKLDDLLHSADVALYNAKSSGRNRVHCASNCSSQEMPSTVATATQHVEQVIEQEAEQEVEQEVEQGDVNSSLSSGIPNSSTAPAANEDTALATPNSAKSTTLLSTLLIATVIFAGIAVTAASLLYGARPDWGIISLLCIVALIIQLLQIPMYGEMSVSASMAIVFAAAMLTGIPGVSAVSMAVAISHGIRRKPTYYKFLYNWSVHLLAGLVPSVIIQYITVPFELYNVHILIFPALIGALFYYILDTGLIAAAISFTQGSSLKAAWLEQFRWLAGHYLGACLGGFFLALAYTQLGAGGLLVFVLPIFMMHYAQKQYGDHTRQSVKELRRMNAELSQATREIEMANQSIKQMNHELFQTLAHILDARDPYVHNHSLQVCEYATAIATRLGLTPEVIEHTRQAAYLHDIGKIGIAESILHKPDRLTDVEYEVVKDHVEIGASVLKIGQCLRHLAPLVRFHHERWDGRGYPDGLKGEEIPIESRILAICDSVEAMASDRPYHRALSLDAIIAEIRHCSGTQFDPSVVDVFVGILEEQGTTLVINSARQEYISSMHRQIQSIAPTIADEEQGIHPEQRSIFAAS